MSNSLIKLLNWVTNGKICNAGDNPPEVQTDGLRKCLELIECIVAISRDMFPYTPFHLGLAIQVDREFVANHIIEHINGERYIPSGIRPITQGGHLIQEGSDSIDINAETVDGKNTFHSLARAVFQSKSVDELAIYIVLCAERIKRGTN